VVVGGEYGEGLKLHLHSIPNVNTWIGGGFKGADRFVGG
jgi:hypothetical protein